MSATARARRPRVAPRTPAFRAAPAAGVEEAARAWLSRARAVLGTDFLSAYLTGDCLMQDFDPRRMDVQVLVVVRSLNRNKLESLARSLVGGKARPRVVPLLDIQAQLLRSLDSLPIELLAIREHHLLLEGRHVLDDLRLPKEALRLQCERELRQRVQQMRQAFITNSGSTPKLRDILQRAPRDFASLFRTLLRLRGEIVPGRGGKVIEKMADSFGLEGKGLMGPYLLQDSMARRSAAEIRRSYLDFLDELEDLTVAVDGLSRS